MAGPPTGAVSYRGPVLAPGSKNETPVLLNLFTGQSLAVTSVASVGTWAGLTQPTDFTVTQDFADMAALYQEFRVLKMSTEYVPRFTHAISPAVDAFLDYSVYLSPLFLLPSHGDNTVISTNGAALVHQPNVHKSINLVSKASVSMSETDEAMWFSTTSATVPIMCIKNFFTYTTLAATPTLHWGWFYKQALFQFRGRVQSATQFRAPNSQKDAKDSKSSPSPQQIVPAVKIASDKSTSVADVKPRGEAYDVKEQYFVLTKVDAKVTT